MGALISDQEQEAITDINITPFVDVVLVLLVIFMITAPLMVQQVLEVELPSSQVSVAPTALTMSVSITDMGQFLLNSKVSTDDQIREYISLKLNKDRNLQAIIAADQETAHKHVVRLMDLLKTSGLDNLAFQVEAGTDSDSEVDANKDSEFKQHKN